MPGATSQQAVKDALHKLHIFAAVLGTLLCFITVYSLIDLIRLMFWGGSTPEVTLALNVIWGAAAIALLLMMRFKIKKLEAASLSLHDGKL